MSRTANQQIARDTYEAVQRYFDRPGVQEEFERWRKERRAHEEHDRREPEKLPPAVRIYAEKAG